MKEEAFMTPLRRTIDAPIVEYTAIFLRAVSEEFRAASDAVASMRERSSQGERRVEGRARRSPARRGDQARSDQIPAAVGKRDTDCSVADASATGAMNRVPNKVDETPIRFATSARMAIADVSTVHAVGTAEMERLRSAPPSRQSDATAPPNSAYATGRDSGRLHHLELVRRFGESIVIDDTSEVIVKDLGFGSLHLGIQAPKAIPIYRAELYRRMVAEGRAPPRAESPPDTAVSDLSS